MIRRESKEAIEADDDKVAQSVQGDTISAFMRRREIGFPKQVETPRLVQRRGADLVPPKHWTQEQIEEQEERGLVLQSRAPGNWLSCTRWWTTQIYHPDHPDQTVTQIRPPRPPGSDHLQTTQITQIRPPRLRSKDKPVLPRSPRSPRPHPL